MEFGNYKNKTTKSQKLIKHFIKNKFNKAKWLSLDKNYKNMNTFGKFFRFFGVSGAIGILLASILYPITIITGFTNISGLPSEISEVSMGQKSKFLAADGTQFATFFSENRVPVESHQIAQEMKDAIISIEDNRFYEHGGFDVTGIIRAIVANIRGNGTQQGASTLTQQYVKNMLKEAALTKGDYKAYQKAQEISLSRKIREAKLAISVERSMTKDEILAGYLNVAYYGAQAYGIEAAANTYFNKSALDISLPEAAYLAGVIQNPTAFDAFQNLEAAQNRRNQVLERMKHYKYISDQQYKAAIAVPVETHYNITQQGCQYATHAKFFCSYVVNTILNSSEFGPDIDSRRRMLERGGLTVNTTLDTRLQNAADIAVVRLTPTQDPSGVVSGLVSVQSGTGKVLAMSQSREYDSTPNPPYGSTSINYLVDRHEGGSNGFQLGSTYKTFVLTEWLKKGNHLLDLLSAERVNWPSSTWRYGCPVTPENATDDWNPQNSDGIYGGMLTVQDGTVFSTNTVFTQMAAKLDLCSIRDTAASMGMHRADGQPLKYSASSILGSNEVAPLTVAAAYATFANEGTFCKPIAVNSIIDASGKSYKTPTSDCKRVLSSNIANGINYVLKDDAKRGTANGIDAGGAVVAGKTGTTDGSAQTWIAGYTKGISTVSWVGNPDFPNKSLSGMIIGGRKYGEVYAKEITSPNWSNYMSKVGTLYDDGDWPAPTVDILGNMNARSYGPITNNKIPYKPIL